MAKKRSANLHIGMDLEDLKGLKLWAAKYANEFLDGEKVSMSIAAKIIIRRAIKEAGVSK